MIHIEPRDFRPLEEFEYLQFWTDPTWYVLPASDLARIKLLTEEKTEAVREYEHRYLNELYQYAFVDTSGPITTSSLFEWIRRIEIDYRAIENIQQYLLEFVPPGDHMVIVSWNMRLAVIVPWHIFWTYWSAFSIPNFDAVCVWPLTEEWFLELHHEDQLIFGKPRLPLLDEASRRSPEVQPRPFIHKDEIIQLLKAKQPIAAIKLYQQETGVGYKKAIEAIKKLEEELRQSSD